MTPHDPPQVQACTGAGGDGLRQADTGAGDTTTAAGEGEMSIDPDDFEGWYAVQTKQHAEARVVEEMAVIGLKTYMPMERHHVTRNRRKQVVERPLLRRYVFAEIMLKGDFYRVKHASGVDNILSSAEGKPRRIPESQLDGLREFEANGLFDSTVERKVAFTTGQVVKILDGPFHGFMATIERGGEDKTFHVLAWLFGRPTRVTVDARHLKAA